MRQRIIIFILFIISLSALVSANPVKSLFQEGTNYFLQGEYRKAIEKYEQIIKIYPEFAPAYIYMGMCKKAMGEDIENVAWYFKKAVSADPNNAFARDNLGKAYYNMGEFDKALEECKKALELKPDLITSQLALGWIYLLGKSMPDESIKYFEQALNSSPTPYGYFGLGISYHLADEDPKVLDTITSLRMMQEENLAILLERMVRDETYIPPIVPGMPLIMKQADAGAMVQDFADIDMSSFDIEKGVDKMKVRLRSSNDPNASNMKNIGSTISGEERIRELQQRSWELPQQ